MADKDILFEERKIFDDKLDHWLHEGKTGKTVVIKNTEILGFYPTEKAAYEAGTEKYGERSFFMAIILPRDAVNTTFFGRVS